MIKIIGNMMVLHRAKEGKLSADRILVKIDAGISSHGNSTFVNVYNNDEMEVIVLESFDEILDAIENYYNGTLKQFPETTKVG